MTNAYITVERFSALEERLAAIEAQPGTPALEARIANLEAFKHDSEEMTRRLKEMRPDLAKKLEQIAAPVSAPTPHAFAKDWDGECAVCGKGPDAPEHAAPAPWGNKPGFVDHPKGCACGLCVQPAAPGDDAAEASIDALSDVLSAWDHWEDADEKKQKRDICRAIIAAIRAGSIPGVRYVG